MALFGKKNASNISSTMETVDFSNDTWSYKGDAPNYQIQSDGFIYDIQDADGNEKNAICLGLLGMLIVVLNAKSPKIKEDELLPLFSRVIKTRNWHTMTVKEANFLSQTAIKKLSSSAMSGDVFDLASYAPLEIKRVLLKTLFSISRTMMKVEFRENAEHRIIDDIVPEIFANPDYELALLTGLIVKSEPKPEKKKPAVEPRKSVQPEPESEPEAAAAAAEEEEEEAELKFEPESKLTFESMPQASTEQMPVPIQEPKREEPAPRQPEAAEPPVQKEPMAGSAFDELQRLYGRSAASVRQQTGSYGMSQRPSAVPEPTAVSQPAQPAYPQISSPETANFSAPQPNNPFAAEVQVNQPAEFGNTGVSYPQLNDRGGYSQNNNSGTPDFASPQPNNPFAAAVSQPGSAPQSFDIPRPSMPDFGMNIPQNSFSQMGPGAWGGNMQQGSQTYNIPQPPMPNYGMGQMSYPQNPYNQPQNNQGQNYQGQNPNLAWQQTNAPYGQAYPQQNPMPQNNQNMMNNGWQGYPQQNMRQGYPQQPGFNAQNMPNTQGWPNNQQPQQPNSVQNPSRS